MKRVKEYEIGDEVVIHYNDGQYSCKVKGTIIDKWWSNKWDAPEPDPEYPDLKEEWFYLLGDNFKVYSMEDVEVSRNVVPSDVKFSVDGETHKSFLINRSLSPEYKIGKKLEW